MIEGKKPTYSPEEVFQIALQADELTMLCRIKDVILMEKFRYTFNQLDEMMTYIDDRICYTIAYKTRPMRDMSLMVQKCENCGFTSPIDDEYCSTCKCQL